MTVCVLCFLLQSLDPHVISDARILVLLLVSEYQHCTVYIAAGIILYETQLCTCIPTV